ncbi:MAG: OmpH family outer membrane protein, partial [Bacteroidales bacterium]
MKRFTAIVALMVFVIAAGHSQNLKFGHINSDELIQAMPEYDSATAKLEKFRKELVNALELMTVELNNKNDAYTKEAKNLTDIVKQTKEQELVDLNKRIQEFQQNAQEQLQNKQVELYQPIYTKVDKAIKDVGKENGF